MERAGYAANAAPYWGDAVKEAKRVGQGLVCYGCGFLIPLRTFRAAGERVLVCPKCHEINSLDIPRLRLPPRQSRRRVTQRGLGGGAAVDAQ